MNKGEVAKASVDTTNTEQLIRLLDTVVIKLEGGSDDDLKVLDEKPVEIVPIVIPKAEEKKSEEIKIEEKMDTAEKVDIKKSDSKKRRRTHSDSSSSSSSSDSDSDTGSEKNKKTSQNGDVADDGADDGELKEEDETKPAAEEESTPNEDSEMKDESGELKPEITEIDDGEKPVEEVVDLDKEDEPKDKKLEELHKTSSIFLRNLAPTITKAEVEALCKRYDGFLRVAIADPLVERRWFRRGWITFKRDVNIKEICWNLNNIRLRDCELGAIVNRDLSRRVRPVNGLTGHKTVCKTDIKLCAKIAHSLDEKSGLWKDQEDNGGAKATFGLQSKNPVLSNITDYLIDEADAEEEELLGLSSTNKEDADGEMLERDSELISVLDKIILYLRIVHSVDFYNHCEYPYEDEMPNRCGIIHARGPPPQNKITSNEIQEYIKNFESKISQFLAGSVEVSEDELKKLGAKDIEAEVEKFMSANSQELAKDKWLCPLSGKKFKGPDYIRKHILNKHAEKVEEVKKEVEYFNNYLKDSKRPQLPEHPGNAKKDGPAASPMYRQPYAAPMQMYHQPYAAPMMRGRGGFSRGGGRMEAPHRPVIHYRDLDAPSSSVDDIF